MIDANTGVITLHDGQQVDAKVSLLNFMKTPLGLVGTPKQSATRTNVRFDTILLDGLPWGMELSFDSQQLTGLRLWLKDQALPADLNMEFEEAREKRHEAWLKKCLGSVRSFHWGSAGSTLDVRAVFSFVSVQFVAEHRR
jgi:hypothetical protein